MDSLDRNGSVPPKFQPMPKRFMVWDKTIKCFLEHPKNMSEDGRYYRSVDGLDSDGWTNVFDITNLIMMGVAQYDRTLPDMIICQSTNLFDKDGREIFEGALLETKSNVKLYVLQKDGRWSAQTSTRMAHRGQMTRILSLIFATMPISTHYGRKIPQFGLDHKIYGADRLKYTKPIKLCRWSDIRQ